MYKSNFEKSKYEQKIKEDFIGEYLDKKMKGHRLPYGMEYLNRVATMEDKAGKLWEITTKSKIFNNS